MGAVAQADVIGPEFIEDGDAGSLPGSAQPVRGTGSVGMIRGNLDSVASAVSGFGDFQDMYLIDITDPENFVATTALSGGYANFDSAIWLFQVTGHGLLGNDDTLIMPVQGGMIVDGATIRSPATDDTMQEIPGPGLYLLAITFDFDGPVDSRFNPLFEFDSQTEISGPDGPGGGNPIGNWSGSKGAAAARSAASRALSSVRALWSGSAARAGNGQGEPGEYVISLVGVTHLPPAGACCIDLACINEQTADECGAAGGVYLGDDTECPGDYLPAECDSAFEDISATGLPGPEGDDTSLVVPLGFEFNFFGGVHSEIRIATNGYLTFGSTGGDFSNDPIPDDNEPNDLIAPLWTDLDTNLGGAIQYQTLGSEPDRRFIAQWTAVAEFGNADDTATFQAVLYEGSGRIEFRYGELDGIPSFPGDTSIGIENADGSAGIGVSDQDVEAGDCLSFCPEPSNICQLNGGCCLPDHTCILAAAGECEAQGGSYLGDGTDCTDAEPPVVVLDESPSLWPPNHAYRTFTLADLVAAVEDGPCAAALDINAIGQIVSIYSDEPENGMGDGNTQDDIVILGPTMFKVRSERQGGGNGRVYGVTFTAADAAGNETTALGRVTVPHSQRVNNEAIDDGPAAGYTVYFGGTGVN
jgi:hypothetical protein